MNENNNIIIELKNIKKSYKTTSTTEVVLQDLTYSFERGLITSILGSSGCGKSTLMNLIGGIDSEFQGELLFNGKAIVDFDSYRRENISFIFQDLNLIAHLNLIKNITIGLSNGVEDKEEKALDLLDRVGLLDHAHKKPNQLSGGEKQRVAIARALARDTDILLCDEPTGSLDEATKVEIMALIIKVFKNKTVIFITHDEELAHTYSHVILNIKNKKLETLSSNTTEVSEVIKEDNTFRKAIKSFDMRFEVNLLSRKLSLFNATYLLIIIAAIFIFATGIIQGVEREIDRYLFDTYKTDQIVLYARGLTLNGIEVNVNDYNKAHDTQINGFMTGLYATTTFVSTNETRSTFFNSLQPALKENIQPDIVYGRFPQENNEILFSKGAAIQTLYDFHGLSLESDEAVFTLFEWLVNLSDEALFLELTAIDLSYKNVYEHADKRFYNRDFEIVGMIDDYKYLYTFEMTENRRRMFRRSNYNSNTELSVEYKGETKKLMVNDNIYMLEEEFKTFLSSVYLGANDQKFQYFRIFIKSNDLDLRNEVFDNFLLFKPIFEGRDDITIERDVYYSDVYGYKVAILGGCVLLFIFAVLSLYNGIKTNILRHRKSIGIYKSLGYSSNNIKSMFLIEGLIIAVCVSLSTLLVWFIINLVMNEHIIKALDPNRLLGFKRIIHLNIYALVGVVLAIVCIILASISKELRKVNIVNLLK